MMVQTRANVILASRQHEDNARSKAGARPRGALCHLKLPPFCQAAHPFARILLSGICVELVARAPGQAISAIGDKASRLVARRVFSR